jgi:hypothetical protein
MIVFSLCNTCWQSYDLLIESGDAPLIKEISDEQGHTCACPRLCGGVINLVGNPIYKEAMKRKNIAPTMSLTAKSLYKAVNGLGLPDELPKSQEIVESMLKANRIAEVSLEEINGKFYIHELRLENGVTLHLSSGIRGAQVLKMTKENKDGPRNSFRSSS